MLGSILAFIVGCAVILAAIRSAVRTFVVPRGGRPDGVTRSVFIVVRALLDLPLRRASETRREQALAYLAPISLLSLPVVWLGFVLLGYTAIYRALGATSWSSAITISRLSLLYLGSNITGIEDGTVVGFSETVLSLLLAAILVSYLPAIYSAFSQREQQVTGLETLAGSPPAPVKMIKRFYLIKGLGHISDVWPTWQAWFETVEESHTALIPLIFYRSPQPHRSWVTAAGAILDTASIVSSTLDMPRDARAELCIRAGYLCLQRVATPLGVPFNPDPAPTDPISVSREEYDAVYDELVQLGVPVKPDRDQAWRDFAGWRVNYDAVLIGLAVFTMAPPGVWSSDRVSYQHSPFVTAGRSARQAATAAMNGRLERPGNPRAGSTLSPPERVKS